MSLFTRVIDNVLPHNWLGRILIFGLLIFLVPKFIQSFKVDNEIEQFARETPGTVVDFYSSGRSNLVSVFEYTVNGRTYRTSSIDEWFKDCLSSKWCIGERYLVRYSSVHPEYGKVLWDKPLPRVDTIQHQ